MKENMLILYLLLLALFLYSIITSLRTGKTSDWTGFTVSIVPREARPFMYWGNIAVHVLISVVLFGFLFDLVAYL